MNKIKLSSLNFDILQSNSFILFLNISFFLLRFDNNFLF